MDLNKIVVPKFNNDLYEKILRNWDALAKPIDGLGEFEKVLSRIGAVQGSENIDLEHAALTVFISDNGVIEEGVSQSDEEVTYQVACALGKGTSTVCHMAKAAGADVFPVNVGMKRTADVLGVTNYSVSYGTKNFVKEDAMTYDEMISAIEAGFRVVEDLSDKGYKVLLLGEMGIGNTTTSAAVLASILSLPAEKVCSRGAGLSDDGLHKKVYVVDKGIDRCHECDGDALEILRKVGGLDIAALTGAIISACLHNIAIISDGFITATAALIASRLKPEIKDYVIFSHNGREKGIAPILNEFGAKPVIDADMALGEGTGACVFLSAAKTALSVYSGNTRFDDINIDSYKRFN
ncbi:MAG: nicotinate-nucleotide--dimethylbenzimidazole phosphoribosyltransferase [Lachnospiraceae bacterium]|nr:nicotinate-nucleotide--dimethylbenzimidazole phosphoribosyltransferase [Lachnospiraceae bacterium]